MGRSRGRGYITPAMRVPKIGNVMPETDEQRVAELMGATPVQVADAVQALLDSPLGCEHVATVTTPRWPVIHRSPVSVGDHVHVLPPALVTECVTCGKRVDLDAPRFTVDLGEQP